MRNAAIILAGGSGKRFGGSLPKQFVKLSGKELFFYSIEKFIDKVEELVVVCHKDYISILSEELAIFPEIKIVDGGETRQLSVRNGLLSLKDKNIDYVAIHDSSRPLFSKSLVDELFKKVAEKMAIIPAISVTSTLARAKDGIVCEYPDRDELFVIQTPQVFKFDLILEAHEAAFRKKKIDFTDDSQIINFVGKKVFLTQGEETNIKITTQTDLIYAEWLLSKLNE